IGAPLEELRGKPRRHRRQLELVDRFAASDRPWVAPQQDRERILQLRDLRLELRNLRRRSLVLRLGLGDVHLRDLPVLELELEELDRFAVGSERLFRDRELLVEPTQLNVVARDGGDQRENYAAACFIGGEKVGKRRLALAADAPPEVDLPACGEQGLIR